MTWSEVGRTARVGYILRFPLLTLLILILFGPVACLTSLANMLGALFDMDGSWLALLSLDFVAVLVAMAAITSINLVLWHGTERFGDPAIVLHPHRRTRLILAAGMACPLVPICFVSALTILTYPMPVSVFLKVLAAVCGYLGAAALAIAAYYLQLRLTSSAVTPQQPVFLLLTTAQFPKSNVAYIHEPGIAASTIKKGLAWLGRIVWTILRPAGQGYLIPGRVPPKLYNAHVFVLWLASFSVLVYLTIGNLKQRHIGQDLPLHVPSLTYVLLFLMVLCWGFSALAFFFDRYRVPVFLTFILLTQITRYVPESDHFYTVVPAGPNVSRATPGDLLRRRMAAGKVPILIATAGGGIQAAAWTTQVLFGLSQQCHCDLTQSVVLVSSVSGGSVGALYFGASPHNLRRAANNAVQSSLDDVAWGWINPDVRRAVFPWFRNRLVDRGWALEQTWEERASPSKEPLSDWARRTAAADPPFPAFLFNATLVERGSQLVFVTSTFQSADSFHTLYSGYDLPVATAVRLSSSFPYVAPTARSDAKPANQPDFHVVDGGYYDNYGLLSLMEWLNEALGDLPAKPPTPAHIRILEIRSFPTDEPAPGSVQGWGFQTYAPASAFLNVRSSAQYTLSQKQLALFEDKWSATAEIEAEAIEFPQMKGECGKPPLSWKLTAAQQGCVESGWEALNPKGIPDPTIAKVVAWFSQSP
jgi:hypothetical protein